MNTLIRRLRQASPGLWTIYLVVYLAVGASLQLTAPYTRVAAFAHDWQVFTLYGLFLVPLSIVLRDQPWHTQYAYSVAAIAPIDIIGFALGTSVAYPGNLIERVVGPRSFTLAFVLIASWIPVAGNIVVSRFEAFLLERRTFERAGRATYRGPVLQLSSIKTNGRERDQPFPPAWQ